MTLLPGKSPSRSVISPMRSPLLRLATSFVPFKIVAVPFRMKMAESEAWPSVIIASPSLYVFGTPTSLKRVSRNASASFSGWKCELMERPWA